jgi:hypothetical protein
MIDAWYQQLTNHSWYPSWSWNAFGRRVDDTLVDSDFADCSLSWGNDCSNTDNCDALMVGLHGGNTSDDHRWMGYVRVDETGIGNCFADQANQIFGNTDLEFLHLSSCVSMDQEDWWNEWNSSFDGLHQVDGFHGVMWIHSWLPDYYADFAADAVWISIADAFIDNLYINNISDSYDQCPVARNVGSDSSDSRDRMDNERYNNVFPTDPPGLGVSRNHRARYILGCDPKDGQPCY